MTETERLRVMLDERGVEWWPSDERWNADVITHWYAGLLKWTAIEGEDGLWVNAGVAGHNSLTPEQAIATTMGPCSDSCNCTNGERTNLAVTLGDADATPTRQGDAVEVVRCRDCKHYSEYEWIIATDVSDVCHFFGDGVKVEPDGFCKWGESREVDA